MKKTFTRFVISLAASIGLLSVGAMGVAGASSITNTGPGSSNYISGSSGSIDTTGPGSVNVISNGCGNSCGGCNNSCDKKDDCVKPPPEKDCDKPVVKHHHCKWCWKLCGHTYRWCQVQVS
jgi:hypothetical protein